MNFDRLFTNETAHVVVDNKQVFFYPEKKYGYHAAADIKHDDIPDIAAACKKHGMTPSTIYNWEFTPTHFAFSIPGKLRWRNFPHEMHYSEDHGETWRWILGHADPETGFIIVDKELGEGFAGHRVTDNLITKAGPR